MISFAKSFDNYSKDLTISTNNSSIRGAWNLLIGLSFLVLFYYFLIQNLFFPKPFEIEDMGYIHRRSVDLKSIDFKFEIGVLVESDLYPKLCFPYYKIGNDTFEFTKQTNNGGFDLFLSHINYKNLGDENEEWYTYFEDFDSVRIDNLIRLYIIPSTIVYIM